MTNEILRTNQRINECCQAISESQNDKLMYPHLYSLNQVKEDVCNIHTQYQKLQETNHNIHGFYWALITILFVVMVGVMDYRRNEFHAEAVTNNKAHYDVSPKGYTTFKWNE